MKANRRRDTAPELALRSALHKLGLRFRVDAQPVEGLRRKADILFPTQRVAIFVDGCFWHGCPIHGTKAKQNAAFWNKKIRDNQKRDEDTNQRLAEAGWKVLRFWEHDDPISTAAKVRRLIERRMKKR